MFLFLQHFIFAVNNAFDDSHMEAEVDDFAFEYEANLQGKFGIKIYNSCVLIAILHTRPLFTIYMKEYKMLKMKCMCLMQIILNISRMMVTFFKNHVNKLL